MKRILLMAALLAVLTGLSSCESSNDYEPTLYETIAGRTWSGDMDMHDNGRLLIEVMVQKVALSAKGISSENNEVFTANFLLFCLHSS